jgi:hypothetical protein
MATIINTPAASDNSDSGAGWAVAVLILLVVIGAGVYFWLHYRTVPATGMNINVTLPQNPITSSTTPVL